MGSIRWLIGRNRWMLVLSVLSILIVVLLAGLGIDVSKGTNAVKPAIEIFGIGFLILRVAVISALLTVWTGFTERVIGRLAKSRYFGRSVRRSRYRILFYYLLLEAIMYIA